MTIQTPTVKVANTFVTPSTANDTTSWTPTQDALYVMHISAAILNAAVGASSVVDSTGITWTHVASSSTNNDNVTTDIWWGSTHSPAADNTTINFSVAPTSLNVTIYEVLGGDASAPIVQSNFDHSATTSNITLTLPSAVTSGNATMLFIGYNANSGQSLTAVSAGYAFIAAAQQTTSPSDQSRAMFHGPTGTAAMTFTSTNASNTAYVGIEIKAASGSHADVAASGAGAITVAGTVHHHADVSLAGSGSISTTPVKHEHATVSVAGTGTTTVTAGKHGDIALAGTGSISVVANLHHHGDVTLPGVGSSTITVPQQFHVSVTLTGTGTVTATPRKGIHASASLAGNAATAVGVQTFLNVGVTLTGTGAVTATIRVHQHANVALAGVGVLTILGHKPQPPSVSWRVAVIREDFPRSAKIPRTPL